MNRQEALAVLEQRMKGIPHSDTITKVVFYQHMEGQTYIPYPTALEADAVKMFLLTELFQRSDNGRTPIASFRCILEHDMELSISIPLAVGDNHPLSHVDFVREHVAAFLQRRQVRPRPPCLVAFLIDAEDRYLLPVTADIIATGVDADSHCYAIVAPKNINYADSHDAYKALLHHFTFNWVRNIRVMYHIPQVDGGKGLSRTGKTEYFHVVHASTSFAGYAEKVLEIEARMDGDGNHSTVVMGWMGGQPDRYDRPQQQTKLVVTADIFDLWISGMQEISRKMFSVAS